MATKTFNPEMLVLARESCGLSQKELSEIVGIVQSKISKYENQLIEPDDIDVERVAAALGYSREFFYQKDKVYGLGCSALFNRRRQVIPVALQKQAQARVNVWRIQIARLMRSVEVETRASFIPIDVQEHDGNVERIAQIVRACWQLPSGPVIDLTAAVENAGGVVVLCDLGTSKIDAAHLWLPDSPPLFFLNQHLSPDRYRFTLAHEIGHAIMHHFPVGDIEDEANRFASEFLMPTDEIKSQLVNLTLKAAAALKPHWRVSMAALIRKAHDHKEISDRQYQRLNEQISALGYRTNEPVALKMEKPSMLRHVVEYHRRSLGYKDRDMEKLLYRSDWEATLGEQKIPSLRISNESLPLYARDKDRKLM